MFRALGARLTLDWRGVDTQGVATGAAQTIWSWAARGMDAPRSWTEGAFTDGICRLTTVASRGAQRELLRTIVHRPDEWDQTMTWRITVDMVCGEKVELGIAVDQEVRDPSILPVPLQPPLVELVRELVDRGAWAGSQRAVVDAQAVVGTEGTQHFVDSVLLDSGRVLPVLLFTAIKEHDGVFMPEGADPSLVARELCGLAHVHLIPRVEDTHKLTKRLGLLSAYDGAVRLYWPHFRLTDRPPRHPLHLRSRLTTATVLSIIRRVVDSGARVYRPPAGTQSLLALRWRRRERAHIIETAQADATPAHKVAELTNELDHAIDENVRLAQELETVRIELDRAQRLITELTERDGDASSWDQLGMEAMRAAITVPAQPRSS
jgi:hypothetical protein